MNASLPGKRTPKVGDRVRVTADTPMYRGKGGSLSPSAASRGDEGEALKVYDDGDLGLGFGGVVRPEDVEVIEEPLLGHDDEERPIEDPLLSPEGWADVHAANAMFKPKPALAVGQRVRATRVVQGEVKYPPNNLGVVINDNGFARSLAYEDGWSFEVLAEPKPTLPTTPGSIVRHLPSGDEVVLISGVWAYVDKYEPAHPTTWAGGFTVVRDAGADQ